LTLLIDESRYTAKERIIELSGFLTNHVYVWQKEIRERKQRMPEFYLEEVNAAIDNILAYPHMGGKKGAMMLAYHQIEYIGQRCYDFVKKQVRMIIFAEIKRRNLQREKVSWPKQSAQYYGEIWCADFTHILLYGQVIYIAIVLDCYSCYYLGYSVSATADVNLVEAAFQMAMKNCQGVLPERYLVNDQGSQYKAAIYQELLKKYEIKQKFIPKGTPWNNGEAEVGMKDIQALFYRQFAQTPRDHGQPIVSQAQAMADKIFKDLNEYIPRLKLDGVTAKDVKDNQTQPQKESIKKFVEERKQKRESKSRLENLNQHIRQNLELEKKSARWLKNSVNLINHQYELIIPEGVG